MRSFAFESLDAGRLTVNRDHASLFRLHGLNTFNAFMQFAGGTIAKNALRERSTVRLELQDAGGKMHTFFLKRHVPPPLKEYVKPLLRLTRPILGARNEWDAILRFHASGIATMVPAALGQSGRRSFLVTAGLEGCQKISEWLAAHSPALRNGDLSTLRDIIAGVADVAKTMHEAGLHHQDFYLGHLMLPQSSPPRPVHVLDLGRARFRRPLSRRWVVKDLAQLDYSASAISPSDRLRFFAHYVGRPVEKMDRALIRRILNKSRSIAQHSRKNAL